MVDYKDKYLKHLIHEQRLRGFRGTEQETERSVTQSSPAMGIKSRAMPAQRQPSKHTAGYRKMLQAWTDESRVRFLSNHQLCAIEPKW